MSFPEHSLNYIKKIGLLSFQYAGVLWNNILPSFCTELLINFSNQPNDHTFHWSPCPFLTSLLYAWEKQHVSCNNRFCCCNLVFFNVRNFTKVINNLSFHVSVPKCKRKRIRTEHSVFSETQATEHKRTTTVQMNRDVHGQSSTLCLSDMHILFIYQVIRWWLGGLQLKGCPSIRKK